MNGVLRLIRKLEMFAPLAAEEKAALLNIGSTVRRYATHEDLIREGAAGENTQIILEGLACRYKVLPDGRRQIVAYFLPGDICDVRTLLMKQIDHSIGALCAVEAALLPQHAVLALLERYPRLSRSFWWSTLVEEAIAREWLVNVGHRTAFERMAHLFCEIFWRLQAVGLTQDNRCALPLTQTDLADTLALSAVHVNRTLMDMRRMGIVTLQARQLIIHDPEALRSVAGFNPAYLHLDEESSFPALKRTTA